MIWLAIAAGLAGWLLIRKQRPIAPSAPSTPLPGNDRTTRPVEIAPVPEMIELKSGTTYLAELDVPFFAEALVTEAALRRGLTAEGFLPITVAESRPSFWPSSDEADWFIVVANIGETRDREVPSAVKRAWVIE